LPGNFSSAKIITITKPEIKNTFSKTKKKKSSGYNEITSKILKACASLVSHPLSYIYNHLIYMGIFPDHLKIAVVKPISKTGNKSSMTNYRPISLLKVFLGSPRKLCTVD